jgi:hypothetical protein
LRLQLRDKRSDARRQRRLDWLHKVRAATDVLATGRSISEKTTTVLAVAPIAVATTKRALCAESSELERYRLIRD